MSSCSASEMKLILDLDGTVLFAEKRPGAIAIEGRRRPAFLASETVDALHGCEVIIATGRSSKSAIIIGKIMKLLGIKISGIVAENGGVIISSKQKLLTSPAWQEDIRPLKRDLPSNIKEFSTCLALLKPQPDEILQAKSVLGKKYYLLPDGSKTFFIEKGIGKLQALKQLLADDLQCCYGIGNDLNDLDWLQAVGVPSSPSGVLKEVSDLVRARNGIVASQSGHDAIPEIIEIFKSRAPTLGTSQKQECCK
ncbi:MAG: HAD hydrolase family protein [Desulfitobacteriaceae bacterium]|nr:HAD hydrolase family protein [Desulfitobacteriaceae bacterium]